MLTDKYEIAKIKDNPIAVQHITEYENDLAKEIGGDIVLIAYQRDERAKD